MHDLPTGLDELRRLIGQNWPGLIFQRLGLTLVSVEAGRVELAAPASPDWVNHMDIMHGGWTATLLDTACGMAAQSGNPGRHRCVTIELKVSYFRPVPPDAGMMTVIGRRLHGGRSTAFTEAVLRGPDGLDYAAATSTLAVRPLD